eukprot:gene14024-18565_t
MQMVNRKLPRKDSRNSSRLVCGVSGGSLSGFLSQCSMAMPPMPKRIQANKSTGSTAASGLGQHPQTHQLVGIGTSKVAAAKQ